MKILQYTVYVHLDQEKENESAPANARKVLAAVLYTIADYVNLNLDKIPEELT